MNPIVLTRRMVETGVESPKWYGHAYYDFNIDIHVYYPIPINYFVIIYRSIRYFFKAWLTGKLSGPLRAIESSGRVGGTGVFIRVYINDKVQTLDIGDPRIPKEELVKFLGTKNAEWKLKLILILLDRGCYGQAR